MENTIGNSQYFYLVMEKEFHYGDSFDVYNSEKVKNEICYLWKKRKFS